MDKDVQRRVIGECLRAASEGPFFPDWEFETLFGMSRAELREIAISWPKVDESLEVVQLAIANSLANLASYPHGRNEELAQLVSVPVESLRALAAEWGSRA